MEQFLRGLLCDLERRCTVVRERLAAAVTNRETADHALNAYQIVEGIRREIAALLADPSLGEAHLLSNHLQQYRRAQELTMLVESYPLPFIERYTEDDMRLTRLAPCSPSTPAFARFFAHASVVAETWAVGHAIRSPVQ